MLGFIKSVSADSASLLFGDLSAIAIKINSFEAIGFNFCPFIVLIMDVRAETYIGCFWPHW